MDDKGQVKYIFSNFLTNIYFDGRQVPSEIYIFKFLNKYIF